MAYQELGWVVYVVGVAETAGLGFDEGGGVGGDGAGGGV